MILTINIDNGTSQIGVFKGENLIFSDYISIQNCETEAEISIKILAIFSLYNQKTSEISGAIISSVVPSANILVENAIKRVFNAKIITLKAGVKTGLLTNISSNIGADFIANSVGAINQKKSKTIIFNIGFVTTITYIDEKLALKSRLIMPGPLMQVLSLENFTKQIPDIAMSKNVQILSKDTADAVISGIVYSTVSVFEKILAENCVENIIITGKNADIIMPYIKNEYEHNENLALQGLNIIYHKN